jgi:hypothetical protein
MCLGIAGGALEEARTYALDRKAFGRPICEFQDVQFMIVDMAMRLDAARLLVYRAATGAGAGFPSVYEAVMAKCFANEMAAEVTSIAMQVFGGYGYSKQFVGACTARLAWRVAGGTVQMLRIDGRHSLRRTFSQRRPLSAGLLSPIVGSTTETLLRRYTSRDDEGGSESAQPASLASVNSDDIPAPVHSLRRSQLAAGALGGTLTLCSFDTFARRFNKAQSLFNRAS